MKTFFNILCIVLIFQAPIFSESLKNKDNTELVVGDKINVREKPNLSSKVVHQLRIAERVMLLKKSGIIQKVNGIEGEWVYIDTEYTKPNAVASIKGWVLDYYLAEYSKFVKVSSLDECNMRTTIGDWRMDYELLKNGKYKTTDIDYETKKTIIKFGTIFRYRDVFIFKEDNDDTYDFFFINSDGYLCHYYRDSQGKSFCSKCKMK